MKFLTAILLLALCGHALAEGPATQPSQNPTVRFAFVDVYVDSGELPLAAYQFELMMNQASVSVVGIEGGDHPAFKSAPHHDALEMIHNRVIVAAFSTQTDLPHGRTRMAPIHVELKGDGKPDFQAKLIAAGGSDAKPIAASVAIVEGEAQ